MSLHYINPRAHIDKWSLPDLEVFYVDENAADTFDGPGFYWWPCFPGCLPEGDATGPFATEEEALEDARELLGDE